LSYIQFSVPPLPHYVNVGEATFLPGEGHVNRKGIGVFDLLVVTKGQLTITEDAQTWSVQQGELLILSPDGHHYSPVPCETQTHFFWLHFHTSAEWRHVKESQYVPIDTFERSLKRVNNFNISVPKYGKNAFPEQVYNLMRNLILMMDQPTGMARWKEQSIFHDLLQSLHQPEESLSKSGVSVIAEKTAYFLRRNYKESIDYKYLSEAMNYNSTYISRCMRKVFQCTPLEYLKHYRIDRAKRLLLNTDLPVSRVCEEVGFENTSYFIKCFVEVEKMTPKVFRGKYRALT
jgi:AraC-like DNA-binding protein